MSERTRNILIGSISTALIAVMALIITAVANNAPPFANYTSIWFFLGIIALIYFFMFDFFEEADNDRNRLLRLLGDIFYIALTLVILFFSLLISLDVMNGNIDLAAEKYSGASFLQISLLFTSLFYPLVPISYLPFYYFSSDPRKFYPYINIVFFIAQYLLGMIMTGIFINISADAITIASIVIYLLYLAFFILVTWKEGLPFLLVRKAAKKTTISYRPDYSVHEEEEEKQDDDKRGTMGKIKLDDYLKAYQYLEGNYLNGYLDDYYGLIKTSVKTNSYTGLLSSECTVFVEFGYDITGYLESEIKPDLPYDNTSSVKRRAREILEEAFNTYLADLSRAVKWKQEELAKTNRDLDDIDIVIQSNKDDILRNLW